MDSSDWSNRIRYHPFDTRTDNEFKGRGSGMCWMTWRATSAWLCDAGDGDESLCWARGDAGTAARHDGRTGGAVGGAGPRPAVSRAALFQLFERTVAALEGRSDIVSLAPEVIGGAAGGAAGGGSGSGGGSGYEAAKAAARGYGAAREALLRGAAAERSPLAQWRS